MIEVVTNGTWYQDTAVSQFMPSTGFLKLPINTISTVWFSIIKYLLYIIYDWYKFYTSRKPDLTQIDQSLIGVDTTITPEEIKARSQPLSLDSTTGTITMSANATFGDTELKNAFTKSSYG